jgi:hypothetical protein
MTKLHALLAVSALSMLACAGILEPATEEVDTGAADSVEDGPDDGVHQTTSCSDYLACLEVADKKEYDQIKDKYGEDGSCWQSTKEKMRECDGVCEDRMDALIEDEGADVCEGVLDTGKDTGDDTGTDTGSSGSCPLQAGSYGSEWAFYEDTCGISEYPLGTITVACSGSKMTMTMDAFGASMACSTSGRSFTCEQSGDYYIGVSGTAASNGRSASGTFLIEGPCYAEAEVYLSL